MASVFKSTGAKKYTILYKDENGIRRKKTGTADKGVSERIANAIEERVALRRNGLIDPTVERFAEQERIPLKQHLNNFRAALVSKGNTSKHVETFAGRATRVVEVAGLVRLSDMTTARVQAALLSLGSTGLSPSTVNHHRNAVRGFSRWLWKEGRTAADALNGVSPYNAETDRRHDRRTLSPEELTRLIGAANDGKRYRRMTGPTRALCYRLAIVSGLRYSELDSLTLESFDLGNRPSVTVLASYAKNGQTSTLPIPPDVADDMRGYLATIPPGCPAFPLPARGADMLKVDLQAAGLPYRDTAGQVFDFHSLRCQLATLADRAGISPRTVQRMMRHSSLALTDRYTRPRAADLDAAADSLPSFRPAPPSVDSARATGTDGTAQVHALAATDSDESIRLCDHNRVPDKEVMSAMTPGATRNHNPRVGGSSPSAATFAKPRQIPSRLAVVRHRHEVRISLCVNRWRADLASTRRTLPVLAPGARHQ
jgi:integrase